MKQLLALTLLVLMSAVASAAERETHRVTWDQHSLMIDGKRTFIWGGEMHPFRLP